MINLVVYGVLSLVWLAVIMLASAWPLDERTPRKPRHAGRVRLFGWHVAEH